MTQAAANQRLKLTGAAILVSRVTKVLQAAPAAYPYRSAAESVRRDVVRKRLRKKRRLGEFQEFGFRVRILTAAGLTDAERDWLLWDGWVLGFVEASGLLFGGGGLRDWDGYVTSGARRGSASEHHRRAAAAWLASQPWVARYEVFPLTDAWHGDPWAAGSARDSLTEANGSVEPGVGADSR